MFLPVAPGSVDMVIRGQQSDGRNEDESDTSTGDTDGLPPSALFVLKVIENEGPVSGPSLRETTTLPDRTLQQAVARLRERNLTDSRPNPDDAREKLYTLAEG